MKDLKINWNFLKKTKERKLLYHYFLLLCPHKPNLVVVFDRQLVQLQEKPQPVKKRIKENHKNLIYPINHITNLKNPQRITLENLNPMEKSKPKTAKRRRTGEERNRETERQEKDEKSFSYARERERKKKTFKAVY